MKIIKTRNINEQANPLFWLEKMPTERLEALEVMRQNAYTLYFYGQKQSTNAYGTFQKIFRVARTI